MFGVDGADKKEGQDLLAELIVGKNFQKVFNLNKGSIGLLTLALTISTHAHIHRRRICRPAARLAHCCRPMHTLCFAFAQAGAITDVVTAHFNSDMSSDEAVKMLADSLANSL